MLFGASVRMHVAFAAAIMSIAVYVYLLHREIRKIDQRVTNIDAAIYQRLIEASTYSMRSHLNNNDDDEEEVENENDGTTTNNQLIHNQKNTSNDDDTEPTHDQDDDDSSTRSEDIREMMAQIGGYDPSTEDDNDIDKDDDDADAGDAGDAEEAEEAEEQVDIILESVPDANVDAKPDSKLDAKPDSKLDAKPDSNVDADVTTEPIHTLASPSTSSVSVSVYAEYKLRALKVDDLKAILRDVFKVECPRGNKDVIVRTILEIQQNRSGTSAA